MRSVNALLPPAISVLSAEEAPEGFSARYDALSRSYAYRVLARPERSPFEGGRALWWPHRCDLDALQACAAALPGRHDFTAFTPADSYHHRFDREVLSARWERRGDLVEFTIEAESFLRSMNRVLVGTMLEVASGRRSVEDFVALLGGAPREAAGVTAPARGLYLTRVRY